MSSEILAQLRGLDKAALIEVNNAVVGLIRNMNDREARLKANEFRYGDTVAFRSRDGRQVMGQIERFGPKNISVVELDASGNKMPHRKWRVHPSFLRKAEVKREVPKPIVSAGSDAPGSVMSGTF